MYRHLLNLRDFINSAVKIFDIYIFMKVSKVPILKINLVCHLLKESYLLKCFIMTFISKFCNHLIRTSMRNNIVNFVIIFLKIFPGFQIFFF